MTVAAVAAVALVAGSTVAKAQQPRDIVDTAVAAGLPAGTVADLLKPENKAKLTAILTYHVVPGAVKAAQVVTMNGKEVKTVNGQMVKIAVTGSTVTINGAKVTATDIIASNGVIHVIDTVILPK